MAITRATSVACFVLVSTSPPPPLLMLQCCCFHSGWTTAKILFYYAKRSWNVYEKGARSSFQHCSSITTVLPFPFSCLSLSFFFSASAQSSRNFAAFSIFLSFLFGLPIGFINLSIIYAKKSVDYGIKICNKRKYTPSL